MQIHTYIIDFETEKHICIYFNYCFVYMYTYVYCILIYYVFVFVYGYIEYFVFSLDNFYVDLPFVMFQFFLFPC